MKTIVIEKLGKSRYFAPELNKRLSLDAIFELVKTGNKVKVVDLENTKDVTKETLIKCLHRNFIQNADRIVLKDIEETIQSLDEAYDILGDL